MELYVKVNYLWGKLSECWKGHGLFAEFLAKNFVFIFLQFLIFCFRCVLPKNAAMHPCMLFFGGGTKLKTVCDALLELSKFPQLHEHLSFCSHFLLTFCHYQLAGIILLTEERQDLIFHQVSFWTSMWELSCSLAWLVALMDVEHLLQCRTGDTAHLNSWTGVCQVIKITTSVVYSISFFFFWLQLRCNVNSHPNVWADRALWNSWMNQPNLGISLPKIMCCVFLWKHCFQWALMFKCTFSDTLVNLRGSAHLAA